MDILPGDKDKRLIRMAAWWLRHKYKEEGNKKQIHDDMINCGNPVIGKIYKKVVENAKFDAIHQNCFCGLFIRIQHIEIHFFMFLKKFLI